jgi:CRISPR-associated protein Csb2
MADELLTPEASVRRVSISFTFLNDRYFAASRTGDRSEPEWPPHPGRAFMALVAALYRHQRPSDNAEFVAEREAILALQSLSSPAIFAPPATALSYPKVFVPVNHLKEKRGPQLLKLLPNRREKKERYFPGYAIRPPTPAPELDGGLPPEGVHFIWEGADADVILGHSTALNRLLRFVGYLGTSRSLVSAELCENPPLATHAPLPPSQPPAPTDLILRVAGAGRLEALERHFANHGRRDVPPVGDVCRYRLAALTPPQGAGLPLRESSFGDLFVFRLEGHDRLPLTNTLATTSRFREAVLAHAGDLGRPVAVSGHPNNDTPAADHIGWVPLANVDHEHASGRILGLAVVLPRTFTVGTEPRRQVLAAMGALSASGGLDPRLHLGRLGCPVIRPVVGDPQRESLRPARCTRTAQVWASVTPFVSRHLGSRHNHDARRLLRRACQTVGLPDPVDCALSGFSPLRGVPPANHFLTRREDRDDYRCAHFLIDFGRPVRGPVMLGHYRYFGMGLCLPWNREQL